jgi:hypothetical protein
MKKNSLKKSPIILAVLCALGVNTVLFTNTGHRLQSAIVESDTSSHAEAHLVADEKKLVLKVNVTATNVTKIEGTLNYDDESIILSKPLPTSGQVTITDTDFSKKVVLSFPTPTSIHKGDTLISWTVTPVLPESHTINLTDVTIHMVDGDKPLTTEGTGEF